MLSLKGLPSAAMAASATASASCCKSNLLGRKRLDRRFRASHPSIPSREGSFCCGQTHASSGSEAPARALRASRLSTTATSFLSTSRVATRAAAAAVVDSLHSRLAGPSAAAELPAAASPRFGRSSSFGAASSTTFFGESILRNSRSNGFEGGISRLSRQRRVLSSMQSCSPAASSNLASAGAGAADTVAASLRTSSTQTQQLASTPSTLLQGASASQQHAALSSAAANAAVVHVEGGTEDMLFEKTLLQSPNRHSEWGLGNGRDPFFHGVGSEKLFLKAGRGSRNKNALDPTPMTQEAWELLQASTVYYCNQPVGTVAASDPTDTSPLNYDQVFIRDFIPSAMAFMLSGQSEIVRNFLLYTLQLQSWEKTVDCHRPGEGLMPASFKVTQIPVEGGAFGEYEEHLDPDFGESAIGRVAPVDSGLWWIQLLRAYGRCTGDYSLQQRVDVQTGIKLILKICLADHFDMFPTLITTDGSCMIDRRLGIHGHPLEIQSLLYGALRAAKEMLLPENGGVDLIRAINSRLTALSFHIRHYYWLDQKKLNEIYRYKTEEYSHDAVNKFNIYPDQIPGWLMDWIPDRGGYFLGNVQPAHMDFRFFNLGNMWAVVSALASPQQAEGVLDLVEERWDDLVGAMPMKIVHPALEGEEWRIITGSDPKNTSWSYHNGGSWPVLLWQFTAACIKMGRPHLAQKAIDIAERRLQADRWPEYYDTKSGRFIGKQARLHQTWSIAGYLSSKLLLANPEAVWLFAIEEDHDIAEATSSFLCSNGSSLKRRRYRSTTPLPLIPTIA